MPQKPFLTLKVVKGRDLNVYVGQVEEIPGIVVQAKTKEQLISEAAESLSLYVETFPAEVFSVVEAKIEAGQSEKLIDEQLLKMHLQKVAHNQKAVADLTELIDRGYLMNKNELEERSLRVNAALVLVRLEWNQNH